jgi:hypothetical protein
MTDRIDLLLLEVDFAGAVALAEQMDQAPKAGEIERAFAARTRIEAWLELGRARRPRSTQVRRAPRGLGPRPDDRRLVDRPRSYTPRASCRAAWRRVARRRSPDPARCVGGSLPQRSGGSLNLHVHFHPLAADVVFDKHDGGVRAHDAPPPDTRDLEDLVRRVHERALRWLRRHRYLDDRPAEERGNDTPAKVAIDAFADLGLAGGTFSARPFAPDRGPDVHRAVGIDKDDDEGRERLVRYRARPAFALDRIEQAPTRRSRRRPPNRERESSRFGGAAEAAILLAHERVEPRTLGLIEGCADGGSLPRPHHRGVGLDPRAKSAEIAVGCHERGADRLLLRGAEIERAGQEQKLEPRLHLGGWPRESKPHRARHVPSEGGGAGDEPEHERDDQPRRASSPAVHGVPSAA